MSVKYSRVIAAIGLLLFVCLAYAVVTRQTGAFDSTVRQAIHARATPALTQIMLAATFVGRDGFMAIVGAFFAWRLIKAGRRRDVFVLIGSAVGAEILEQILKLSFHRQRPEPFFGLPTPDSSSFPSGHALMSTVFYLTLAIVMTRNQTVRVAAALLAFTIGLSRVYLGVHYPTDVLAGFAAGTFWLSAWFYGIRNVPAI